MKIIKIVNELLILMEKYFINVDNKPLTNDYWDGNINDCSLFKKLNNYNTNSEELIDNGYRNINKRNKSNTNLRKDRNRRSGKSIQNNKKEQSDTDMLLSETFTKSRKPKIKMQSLRKDCDI